MDLSVVWESIGRAWPCESLFGPPSMYLFRRTLVALWLLAPMLGLLGVQVVNARYAFFSDAVSHAVIAGVGLSAVANHALDAAGVADAWRLDPRWCLPAFAALFGVAITALRRGGRLSVDTATGVAFALVTAGGLCLVHKFPDAAGGVNALVFGQSAGTATDADVLALAALLAATVAFMAVAGNRLALVGLDARLARAHGVRAALYEYAFTALLAVVVAAAARMAGVLMVTALLVVPAAAGRNFARTGRAQYAYATLVAVAAVTAGYMLALHESVNLPAGALSVVCAGAVFVASWPLARRRARAG